MSDLVNRLRGKYRIPITDGLGAAGGEEPENDNEFVRSFPSTPIQMKAADEIERLRVRSEEHTHELQSLTHLVCRLLREKQNC